MIPLRWIGAFVLVLGVASLLIPIPHNERHGIKVGDVSLGVVTQNDEKVPLPVSVVLLVSGFGTMMIGARRSS